MDVFPSCKHQAVDLDYLYKKYRPSIFFFKSITTTPNMTYFKQGIFNIAYTSRILKCILLSFLTSFILI